MPSRRLLPIALGLVATLLLVSVDRAESSGEPRYRLHVSGMT